ncbi:MAG: hypothetical protein PHQ49_06830 [Clostridia bacterium]|jgi:uncharacterized C2H2 Zn-finger protein|nr:hypothetical protein [Clostridia bacterium]
MNRFKRFMMGRYGSDELGVALLILTFLLMILIKIIDIPYLGLLVYIPLGFCLYRILSKKVYKRRQENFIFLGWLNPFKNHLRNLKIRVQDRKTHKYFKCPKCGQMVRLPKGKGKICITCPKCKHEFVKKT